MKSLRAFHAMALLSLIASAALVAGLFEVGRQMDGDQQRREAALVSSQVDSAMNSAKGSIAAASNSDAAVVHLDHRRDADWARQAFPNREAADIWYYTADWRDGVVSGLHAPTDRNTPFEPRLTAWLQVLRAKPHPGVTAAVFWSGGRPHLLLASPFSAASPGLRLRHARPPVLIAVTPLDSFLKPHFAGTGIRGLAVARRAPSGAEKGVAGLDGRSAGALTWRPATPGADLRRVMLPPLLVLVGLMMGLVALAYRGALTSARKLVASEARAHDLAFRDPLTDLANRRFFLDQLERAVLRCGRHGRSLAVLLIDLDRFKLVNDTYGHPCGDELIREVGRRLTDVMRAGDLCARLGGDEFVILAHDCDADAAGTLAHRLLEALGRPFALTAAQIRTGGSVGVSLFRGQQSGEALMREADLALYEVKERGRGRACFFEVEMDRAVQARRALEEDLRSALAENALDVVYQPEFQGGVLVGVEALARWTHPERGAVPPSQFIPLAEECGLIVKLGAFVMRRAFEDSRRWPDLQVAVNVSAVELRQVGHLACVRQLVEELRVDPRRFELELTEGVLLADDLQTQETLVALRRMGFRMALDDFGTGYSSLSYLRRLPVDKIKLDRSFISGLPDDAVSMAVIRAVVELGRTLRMDVIAEGVETREQQRLLSSLGCDFIQGYLLGQPQAASKIDAQVDPALAGLG